MWETLQKRVPGGIPAVLVLAVALAAVAVLAWTAPPRTESADSSRLNNPSFELLPSATPPKGECQNPATTPFTPTSITISHVVKNAKVLALPRDANRVPSTPPVTEKYAFAWDRPPGIMPGSDHGNVLLNAHTWPDGSAVGNELLDKLHKGDKMILRGKNAELCYTVTKRVEVRTSDGYPPYYDTNGSPNIALIVCSGERLGPGNWTHRTIWFAEPIPATA